LRYNLLKYCDENQIKNRFPYFVNNGRVFYDTIYIIKTEDITLYDSYNETLCDTILICCKNKSFNIMFELDNEHPYNHFFTNKIHKSFIENIYNNKNI